MSRTAPGDGGRPLPWLLERRVSVPGRADGHLERAALADRAMPTRRRLTVLQAPGGFGKTTLLAECCRRLRGDGVAVAWVSVDREDGPGVLDTYVAYACGRAGVAAGTAAEAPAGKAGGSRTALAARGIGELGGPFVLAFDEAERLDDAESAALLWHLLESGPPNLHLAIACRRLPAGLDVAGAVLDGRAAILTADDLRFTGAEAATFLGGGLSKARLAAVMSESAGWPIALRVARNEAAAGRGGDGGGAARAFVENWVEARLFAGLAADDREFLLDVGLFEWLDGALVDEALGRPGSMRRMEAMPVLAGMLEPVRDGAVEVRRLHPLIREHCARARARDTPERFRAVHRRIAAALERRGHTVAAMRHAIEAAEPALAAAVLERAGGLRWYVREGAVQLLAADRLLGGAAFAARPRLALVRCAVSIVSGRMEEARERHRALGDAPDGPADDADRAALGLAAERCMLRGMVAHHGSERLGSAFVRAHLAEVARLARAPLLDAEARGFMEYSLCLAAGMRGDFEALAEHAALARRCYASSPYMTMYIDLQEGQAAMALGRVGEAAALYRRARQTAKRSYVADPEPVAVCAVLLDELALECGRAAPLARPARVPEALEKGVNPFQSYAAASGVAVERRLRDAGAASALAAVEGMLAYVRSTRLPALERYVAALRVSVLAAAGRTDEAGRRWASDGLPADAAGCLDLDGQAWREMEALSCARLRLAIGGGRHEEARAFAADLRDVAASRGLRRTLMRALALSMALEARAGDGAAAAAHLRAYLEFYAETPYAGPLVRERGDCAPVVAAFPAVGTDAAAARTLAAAMEGAGVGAAPLSARETEVLLRIGNGQRDRRIAEELGLSVYGVRHHLRKVFARLGVRRRGEAVRRARELGLLPDES